MSRSDAGKTDKRRDNFKAFNSGKLWDNIGPDKKITDKEKFKRWRNKWGWLTTGTR